MGAGTADTARICRKANHREAELYEKIKKEVVQKERYHYHSFHVNKLHHQYIGQ